MIDNDESFLSKYRVLRLYADVAEGKTFKVKDVAEELKVSTRTIHRDIDEINIFLSDRGFGQELKYDSKLRGYKIVPSVKELLEENEAFAVIKMLLECRGLNRKELDTIVDKLVKSCIEKKKQIGFKEAINREKTEYIGPKHNTDVIKDVWNIQKASWKHFVTEIEYKKLGGKDVKHKVVPVGIMFSEFYFYMIAINIDDNDTTDYRPTIYRIDRIKKYKVSDKHFNIPYEKNFSPGEFRKRVQYMFTGELMRIRFYCDNTALEAACDKIPTAEVIEPGVTRSLVKAEVYGTKGINMWLRSQGDAVEVVEMRKL